MVDAQQCQVIYTTHSPIFVDMSRFRSIRVLEKPPGEPSRAKWISKEDDLKYPLQDQLDSQKLPQYMDPNSSEALFACSVLLVEGHGDYLAVRIVAEKLGADLDAEGSSVVACGGKNAIPFFARTCNSFEIPVWVLHDTDMVHLPMVRHLHLAKSRRTLQYNRNKVEKLKRNSEVSRTSIGLTEVLKVF